MPLQNWWGEEAFLCLLPYSVPVGFCPRLFMLLSEFGDAASWAGQAGGALPAPSGEDVSGAAAGCHTGVYFGSG